jgi:hypothetical protein
MLELGHELIQLLLTKKLRRATDAFPRATHSDRPRSAFRLHV